ncbi:Por secretion system C-terminal sorting domain-containing protein [Chryseobacterium shigense]|uniref:Por secretion system C-terminal sorting domain-containing protein n=2 Tax=Chryseobacterium shigense TaxID=297244 RepID=A0A1N7I673_9FLAO|nr:Por secretion system C-terminal sorting domain-containing protein [Chryseobacterium shigense]
MSMGAYAQVGPPQATNPNTNNGYGFAQSSGTYTSLSASRTIWQSGAALGTDAVSAAINLPSAFKYNGKSYSSIYISNNGFVTLGTPALAATYVGLSTDTTTPYEGAFAGFAANLRHASTTTSEISYETVGSKFIVQFTDLQGSTAAAAQIINFQIQLDLTSNTVTIVYGNCVSGTATLTGQVGIRGSESSDMNNRTGTDWTATAIGTSTTSTCTLGSTNGVTVPASGLTFTFTPGTWLSTAPTYATLPFTESFGTWVNGNSTADLPNAANWRTWPSRGDNSWRASDISLSGFTSASGWSGTGGSSTVSAPAVGTTARFHSYNTVNASGYMDLYVNLSTGAGSRILNFDYINPTGTDNLKIQVSTDGGATFNNVGSTYGVSSSWSTKYVDLGTTSATAIVRFLGTGDNGSDDIYVDNVNINALTCLMPDTVTVGTSTATTESVSWTMANPAPAFDIYYSTTNTAPTSASTPNVVGATGTTATLVNLAPLTTYYVWVRSRCSSSDQGLWIAGPSFTTKTFCPVVSAPASSAVNVPVTPTFTWAANADATGYKITIGTTSGGTDVLNNADVGNVTTYTLPTPLNTSTTYYYTVNSYNAGVTSSSCTVRSFTTVCGVITPSYTNNFSNFPGTCWGLANGGTPATGPGTGTTNYWVVDGFLNVGSTGAAKMNLYSTGRQGWLKSPAFNLSAGGYRVKFDYGVTTYNATTSSPMGSDDVVQFVVSTDGGTTWSVLKTWDVNNAPGNTSSTYIFDLANFLGANTMFAIYGSDGTVDDTPDYEFFVDNFVVESIPACDAPVNTAISLLTDSSATISWTAPTTAPANGYQYYFSTTNTAPASGTATTATSQILTPLQPLTTYYYWVRSMCAGTQSGWVSGSFTTLAVPPANDNCSSAINLVVGGAFAQNVVNGTTVGSTNTPALAASCLLAPTNVAGNVWYKVVVPASGKVTIETDAATGTALTDTVLSVFADCTSTTSIACDDDNGNDNFSKVSLTGQTPGATLYASVWRYSSSGGGTDGTFRISAYDSSLLATSEVSAARNEIKAYPNPFADVLNISDISKVKSVSIVDVAGRLVKTIDNPSSTLQLGDLKQGLYLVTLNLKDGSKQTIKAIKK